MPDKPFHVRASGLARPCSGQPPPVLARACARGRRHTPAFPLIEKHLRRGKNAQDGYYCSSNCSNKSLHLSTCFLYWNSVIAKPAPMAAMADAVISCAVAGLSARAYKTIGRRPLFLENLSVTSHTPDTWVQNSPFPSAFPRGWKNLPSPLKKLPKVYGSFCIHLATSLPD